MRGSADPSEVTGSLLVCGDVHLQPHDRGAFFAFLQQLQDRSPGQLVILGDLFEYWLDCSEFVRMYEALFAALGRLSQAGWTVHLVPGNRELAAGRYLATAAPWQVHPQGWRFRRGFRRVRIVHGDRLVRDPGYRALAAVVRSWWFIAWRHCLPLPLQQLIARRLRAQSQRRQRRVADVGAPLAMLDPRRVAAAGRGCELLLAGHIHHQWRRRVRDIDTVLCGHWDPDYGRWVELSPQGEPLLQGQPLPGDG